MNIPPPIAVLLPVYNGKDYLEKCIQSVLEQKKADFELLVSDDASTESTVGRVCGNFSDDRLKLFAQPHNSGLFSNLNFLIKKTEAPIVHFLCQDDWLEPDCLAREIQFFERHPDISLAFCKTRVVDCHDTPIDWGALNDLPEVIDPRLSTQLFYYFGCIPGNLSTVSARRQCFDEIGLFDESFKVSGDYDMWARITQKKRLGVLHAHLVNLRHHEGQLSRKPQSGIYSYRENQKVLNSLYALLPEQIKHEALVYRRLHHDVLATHFMIRLITMGRLRDFMVMIRCMGVINFAVNMIPWFFTLNHRIFKPKPKFV